MKAILARFVGIVLILTVGLNLIGCSCDGRMKKFDLSIQLDPQLRNQTVLVDLVGVSDPNAEEWDAKDPAQYWRQGDSFRSIHLRDGLIHPIEFVAGSGILSNELSRKDDIWNRWKREDAINLYVMVELQSRRHSKTITLDCGRWEDVSELDIRITPDGIFQRQSPKTP